MFQVARIMASERDLAAMLPQFLASLIDTVPVADAGVLMLFDPAIQRLTAVAAQGYDELFLKSLHVAVGESLSGKAFQSRQTLLFATIEDTTAAMADMTPENRQLFRAATAGLRHPLSAVCVPLKTGQESVGVLVLENLRQDGTFSSYVR